MLDKKKFFEDTDFARLAGAKKSKDYTAMIEICDKFLQAEGLDEIEGARAAFEKIKTAAENKNEEALTDGFYDLVRCSEGGSDVKSAKQFINDCTLAIKMGNIKKAKALSKEYAEITADAMHSSGKMKLSDDYLFELAKAAINNNQKKMRRMLAKIQ